MKTADFLSKHDACIEYVEWATSTSQDMSVVWDELISQARRDWLIWTATRPGVFTDSTLRKLACRFVRETPVSNGRTVWGLLTDERSRRAIEVAESYVDGNATKKELDAAYAAADDAAASYAADVDDAYIGATWADYAAASYVDAATRAAAHASAEAAASSAWTAAEAAARAAAHIAAYAAARAAAHIAAGAAAWAAQVRMVAELGNPFKEGVSK